ALAAFPSWHQRDSFAGAQLAQVVPKAQLPGSGLLYFGRADHIVVLGSQAGCPLMERREVVVGDAAHGAAQVDTHVWFSKKPPLSAGLWFIVPGCSPVAALAFAAAHSWLASRCASAASMAALAVSCQLF